MLFATQNPPGTYGGRKVRQRAALRTTLCAGGRCRGCKPISAL